MWFFLCYDTCMFISQGDSLVKQKTFIADSGTSTHMVHSKQFLTDFQAKDSDQIHFSKVLPHGDGKILATEFYTTTACANPLLKATYADLHHQLGHANKQTVQNTANLYGTKLLTKEERKYPYQVLWILCSTPEYLLPVVPSVEHQK
jgi:hypothetical protein